MFLKSKKIILCSEYLQNIEHLDTRIQRKMHKLTQIPSIYFKNTSTPYAGRRYAPSNIMDDFNGIQFFNIFFLRIENLKL